MAVLCCWVTNPEIVGGPCRQYQGVQNGGSRGHPMASQVTATGSWAEPLEWLSLTAYLGCSRATAALDNRGQGPTKSLGKIQLQSQVINYWDGHSGLRTVADVPS